MPSSPDNSSIPPPTWRPSACLRLDFVRALLTPLEQALGPALHSRFRAHLPPRFHAWVDSERLRSGGPMDAIDLDSAEELLQALELALGDRSGHLLEEAAFDVFSHAYARERTPRGETLTATIARLQPAFERLFFGVTPRFETWRSPFGFAFVVGLEGRPKLAEPLRKIGLGAMRAAQHANTAASGIQYRLQLHSGVHGDQAWVRAHVSNATSAAVATSAAACGSHTAPRSLSPPAHRLSLSQPPASR